MSTSESFHVTLQTFIDNSILNGPIAVNWRPETAVSKIFCRRASQEVNIA